MVIIESWKEKFENMENDIEELTFRKVCEIVPKLNENGSPKEYMPQSNYEDRTKIPLHEYGFGPFCRFRIPDKYNGKTGVYIIQVDVERKYIGECEDLGIRFNMGYGNISPRNCYKGGQPTNCRINNLILQFYKKESKIELFFCESRNRYEVERNLIQKFNPEWNKTSGKVLNERNNQRISKEKLGVGKYLRLGEYLKNSNKKIEVLSYDEIERILGFKLPASAYKHRPWWANGGHNQANSWLNAGWKVTSVILGKSITFVKG